jgi:hypothetical protein
MTRRTGLEFLFGIQMVIKFAVSPPRRTNEMETRKQDFLVVAVKEESHRNDDIARKQHESLQPRRAAVLQHAADENDGDDRDNSLEAFEVKRQRLADKPTNDDQQPDQSKASKGVSEVDY